MNMKYLIDGTAVEIVEQCQNGFLIHRFYEDGETGELIADDKIYWVDRVFDAAPTVKFSEDVARLSAKVADLHKQLSDQRFAINEGQAKYAEAMAKFRRYEQLRLLEDFLDGRITHLVHLSEWCPKIVVVKEEKCESHTDKMKLLVLFGNSKGDLQWEISRYHSDCGGGYYETVMPCTSYEQAKEVLKTFLYAAFATGKGDDRYVGSATDNGIAVPQQFLDLLAQRKVKSIQDGIAKCEAQLAEKCQALQSLLPLVAP